MSLTEQDAIRAWLPIFLAVIVIIIALSIGAYVILPAQSKAITNYCLNHPNETLTGELTTNCTEWLAGLKYK